MTRFPKQLVIEANSKMETDDVSSFYEEYTTKLLEWTREKLTTESVAKYIIEVSNTHDPKGSVLERP